MQEIRFDARAAKALTPGNHIVVHGCPGLRLVASATRKTWIYRYRRPSDQSLRQVKIGDFATLPFPKAFAAWQQLQQQRDAGGDPGQAKRQSRADARAADPAVAYTLGQLVEAYAEGYLKANREPKGARAVAARLRTALGARADLPVDRATRAFVFGLIERLLDRPVLAKSVKTEMAAAWRYGVEAGLVPEDLPNWWAEKMSHKFRSKGAMRAGERKGTGKRVLSDAELRTLLTEDLALFSPQVRDFLTLQLWTCTRGAEICQLRRGQVAQEKDGWWWTVPKQDMKGRHIDNAHDLRVPLVGRALKIVEALLQAATDDVPWLFPSRSRAGVMQAQSQAYMQSKVHYLQPYSNAREDHVRRRLQVTHWSPHDLRRTGRTMLAAMRCPHEVGEAILGHVLPGVAGDYNLYAYDRERRRWLKRLAEGLERIAG